MAKKSEVKVEEETEEKPAKPKAETDAKPKAETVEWKKALIVAGVSLAGIWLIFGRKNGEKTTGKPAETAERSTESARGKSPGAFLTPI